jgi:hypothetical protein
VSLAYYANQQRVCWLITTVTESGPDGFSGDLLLLEATSGQELDRSIYRVVS